MPIKRERSLPTSKRKHRKLLARGPSMTDFKQPNQNVEGTQQNTEAMNDVAGDQTNYKVTYAAKRATPDEILRRVETFVDRPGEIDRVSVEAGGRSRRSLVPYDEAATRHARYYLALLQQAQGLYLEGGPSVSAGLALFDDERVNVEIGQQYCAKRLHERPELAAQCFQYALGGTYVLELRLHPRTRIAWLDVVVSAARAEGLRGVEANALGNLGMAYADLGEMRKAIEYYEQDLEISRTIGDRSGEGRVYGNLGIAYKSLGEVRKAIEYHERRLAIAREVGDRRGEAMALGNLGVAYSDLGEVRSAIEYHAQNLAIAREIGDRRGEGNAVGNLGIAHWFLGELHKAIEYHEQHLAIARGVGDRRGEGRALGNLGVVYKDLGELGKAVECAEQWLAIAREVGDRRSEGNALGNLGVAYKNLGEVRKALEFYEQNLAIAREAGDRNSEGRVLGNLGVAYKELGEIGKTIEYFEQRLALAREVEDRRGEGIAHFNLAIALAAIDRKDDAMLCARKALACYEDTEHPNIANVLEFLDRLAEQISKVG
jgi:tetratricopeptide (TPR) repeat protein